jgi:hypothetical protein
MKRPSTPATLAPALVFLLIALLALRRVDSLDVGFHLKAGEHVLDGHGWPRMDPFSYALKDHAYVDTSWGYQVLIAAVQRAGGPAGLVLLHAGLVLALFALLWRTARSAGAEPGPTAAVLLLGTLASELRFAVRPELLTYVLLALLLWLLERHATGRRAPLGWLVPLFLLWANVHSLFVLGWAALGCFGLGLALRDRRLDRSLALWSLAAVVATVVNPYGLRGVLFPFTLLSRFDAANPFQQEIGEFVSPFDRGAFEGQPFYPWIPVWAFRAFAVLAGLAAVVLLVRKRWWSVLLVLVFAWPAVKMIRNTPLLVVAAVPSLAAAWSTLPAARSGLARRVLPVLVALLASGLAWRVATDAYYVDQRREQRFGLGWNRSVLPVDAVDFARRVEITGRPLNHLNFGGWLMWAGATKTYVDGRLEVVGEDFYRSYRAAFSQQDAFEAEAQRWDARWTIFPYATFPQLLGRLSSDPRWLLAYADPVAALFVRAGPEAARFVDPELSTRTSPAPLALETLPGFPAGPPRPSRAAALAAGFASRVRFPSADHYLGLFHLYRGELAPAAARMAAAIRACDGRYYELYANLGAVLFRMKRWSDAKRCYELVLAEHASNALARERLNEINRAQLPR